MRWAPALALSIVLVLPSTVRAQTPRGGPAPSAAAREWSANIVAWCAPAAGTSAICSRLLGGGVRLDATLVIQQNASSGGIHFDARYALTRPTPAPGTGLVPYTKLCGFGLGGDRQRVFSAQWSLTCTVHVRGHMVVRPGAVAALGRRGKLPGLARFQDFWITDEIASIPGVRPTSVVDPLGRARYPIDTRLPVTGIGVMTYDANVYLGILGVPGFPTGQPLPSGVYVSVTMSQMPLVGGD